MTSKNAAAALLLAALLAACGDDPLPSPDAKPAAPPVVPTRHAATTERPARLREDVGGWTPSDELLDRAEHLREWLKEAAAAVEGKDEKPLSPPVDVLRAGLRLADDDLARTCAARLKWQQIDGWECARCVELLTPVVLREDTDADFDQYRSYLGSCDLVAFLHAIPAKPWGYPADGAVSQVHRILRSKDAAAWIELTKRPEPEIAETAWKEFRATALNYDDALLPVVTPKLLEGDGGRTPTGPGLPAYVRFLFREVLDGKKVELDWFDWRALWRAVPAASDADLLCDVASRDGEEHPTRPAGAAMLLLGKLRDARGADLLRKRAEADATDEAAWFGLARRGDAAALDHVETKILDLTAHDATESFDDESWIACLMETAPARARKLLDERLLGDDEAAAARTLDVLSKFTPPGAESCVFGFDWRRTSFDGFEAAALAKPRSASRLALIGIVVPGCRTRRVAAAAARALSADDLAGDSMKAGARAFLETGAPDAFRASLLKVAADESPAHDAARELLLTIGDPTSGARLVEWFPGEPGLARSPSPETRKALADRVRRDVAGAETDAAQGALAIAEGLPEDAASSLPFSTRTPAAVEALLAGRPIDWLAAVLAEHPDEPAGDVGCVADSRVRAYLQRLRERRELGHYWYATGQLAAMGDAACRAEFWQAMQDGRYRIVDESGNFAKTLGWDLSATMPFWVEELRSNCCRCSSDPVRDVLSNGFASIETFNATERTGYERAKDLWDAAGGRFVRSRVMNGAFVPEPR